VGLARLMRFVGLASMHTLVCDALGERGSKTIEPQEPRAADAPEAGADLRRGVPGAELTRLKSCAGVVRYGAGTALPEVKW
jgi:hypothetical protein